MFLYLYIVAHNVLKLFKIVEVLHRDVFVCQGCFPHKNLKDENMLTLSSNSH